VRVEIHGGEGFPRSRDLDNTLKPILDCIRGAEILPNDRVMEVCSIVAEYVPARAKGVKATCWIEVEELTDRAVRGVQGELFE
jgi:Holliday junction resolvase RusA-like endonuclease